MKKTAIILIILSLATWAFGETRIDPTKENGFTHLKRIRNHVVAQFSRGGPPISTEQRLSLTLSLSKEFRWVEDEIEHLQYPSETLEKQTGDCEDFTLYFLSVMRFLGHPIQRLGFALIVSQDKPAHLLPLYQEDDNTWWIWESGDPIGQIAPLAWYLNAIPTPLYTMIFMGFEDYSTVTSLTKTHWATDFLSPWIKAEGARIKAKGYAIE